MPKYLPILIICFWTSLFSINAQDTTAFKDFASRFSDNKTIIYDTVTNIPTPIIDKIESITGHAFKIANPSEDYNSTDLVVYPDKPFRRLCSIFKFDNYWMLCYEHGGLGSNVKVIFIEIINEKVIDFEVFIVFKGVFKPDDLKLFGIPNDSFKSMIYHMPEYRLEMNL